MLIICKKFEINYGESVKEENRYSIQAGYLFFHLFVYWVSLKCSCFIMALNNNKCAYSAFYVDLVKSRETNVK